MVNSMIFCAWQQILFLFANSAVPWNHRALFDQMSVEYRGSQQNLSNYSQKGAKGTLRMQTYKKGGSTEHKNAVRTSADSYTSPGPKYTSSHHTLSSHSSQLPPVNCELYRQMSPGAPGAEAAAERQAERGREKHNTDNQTERHHTGVTLTPGGQEVTGVIFTGANIFPFVRCKPVNLNNNLSFVCLSWTQEVRILMTVYDLFNYL